MERGLTKPHVYNLHDNEKSLVPENISHNISIFSDTHNDKHMACDLNVGFPDSRVFVPLCLPALVLLRVASVSPLARVSVPK